MQTLVIKNPNCCHCCVAFYGLEIKLGDAAFVSALITGCHLVKNGHQGYQLFTHRTTRKLKNIELLISK